MKIPPGLTEKEVLKTIDAVVNQIASTYKFGYHDNTDMQQQGRLLALEALEKESFDPNFSSDNASMSRKLYRFLFSHVKHRLMNFKRDNYSRNEPPCLTCPFYDPEMKKSVNQCAAFTDKNECDKWAKWYRRNTDKQNINKPVDITELNTDGMKTFQYNTDMSDNLYKHQIKELIDNELPASMRSDYLRFLQGCRLPKNKLDKLQATIIGIIHAHRKEDRETE